MMDKYIPTGNEFISFPCINEMNAGINDFTVLHMGYKGMLDFTGSAENPLFLPFVEIDGRSAAFENLVWERENYWIPAFTAKASGLALHGTVLAPIGERGFIYRIEAQNMAKAPVNAAFGMRGQWSKTIHSVNEDKEILGEMLTYHSAWNDAPVFDLRIGTPVLAFAPMSALPMQWITNKDDTGISYEGKYEHQLNAGESFTFDLYWGIGFEEVAAATSAKEMLRQTYDVLKAKTVKWLEARCRTTGDPALDKLLNVNLFFNYFFATGTTIDSEELVMVTSRSPRYYVSAAYWDRDSLLWSFPAVLKTDAEHAKAMLDYTFTRQIRNVGIHSRYIDGTLLEPGFELDELCAPVIALSSYIKETSDIAALEEPHIEKGVKRILKILDTKYNSALGLYETFLQPTDDMRVYPYITYNNALVWRVLTDISKLYANRWGNAVIQGLSDSAQRVKDAIYRQCVREYKDKRIFAWSVDACGNWDVYDEPPGSLQLLPYYGFCDFDDEIWRNTVAAIRDPEYAYSFAGKPFADIGCPHAPHPWILSVGNSLLCGRIEEAKSILLRAPLDNGIACESIDEITGECATGAAFATCAGFLAHCMIAALGVRQ